MRRADIFCASLMNRRVLLFSVLFLIIVFPQVIRSQVSDDVQMSASCAMDVEQFIRDYFETWSSGDMGQYQSMFHEKAKIMLSIDGKVFLSMGRDEFVDMQARELARRSMIEHLTDLKVNEDAVAATATASWLLDDQGSFTTGVDRFTLIRDEQGEWKILFLLFYND